MKDQKNSTTNVHSIFRILVISLLNEKPMTGYDLITSIEELTGNKPSQGKIYPFLHQLLECGHIIERSISTDDSRIKKVYSLTMTGRRILGDVYSQLEYFFKNFLDKCSKCGCQFYFEKERDVFEIEFDPVYCCLACSQS